MNILTCFSDKFYLSKAKQLFSSIYAHKAWNEKCLLLHAPLPKYELEWFTERGILTKEVPPLFNKKIGDYPAIVTSKLNVFDSSLKCWEHVLLLDADIIVRKSLKPLTHVTQLSAVPANGDTSLWDEFRQPGSLSEWWNYRTLRKNYNLDAPAFNSGVIAFPTSIIHNSTLPDLVLLLSKFGSLSRFAEQGVLNLYFAKTWTPLSPVFNTFPEYTRKELSISADQIDAHILHFADRGDENKPWSTQNPFFAEWSGNLRNAEHIHF